jgi:hypothetical protein
LRANPAAPSDWDVHDPLPNRDGHRMREAMQDSECVLSFHDQTLMQMRRAETAVLLCHSIIGYTK